MKFRSKWTCPLEIVHDMISGKWKPIILWRLRIKKMSLSELKRDIKGISEKMLLEHLKDLIECRFISKKSYEGYPLKVEYSLTKNKGRKILKALKIMQDIGIEIMIVNDRGHILVDRAVITKEFLEEKKKELYGDKI